MSAATLAGTVTLPPSFSILGYNLFLYDASDPFAPTRVHFTSESGNALSTSFSFAVPSGPNLGVAMYVIADGDGGTASAFVTNPGTAPVSIVLGTPPKLVSPPVAPPATGVTTETTLGWTAVAEDVAYMVQLTPTTMGALTFLLFTGSTSAKIPDLSPLGGSLPKEERIRMGRHLVRSGRLGGRPRGPLGSGAAVPVPDRLEPQYLHHAMKLRVLAPAFALFVASSAGCGKEASESGMPDAGAEGSTEGEGSPEGMENGDSGQDGAEGQTDVRTDGSEDGPSGPFACGHDGGTCAPGQVCVESIFINGLPTPPDAAPIPNPESDTFSCKGNPCDGSAGDPCSCSICPGGSCTTAGDRVLCETESVCASAETPVATADGERPIASLHPGDLVYSADHGALRLVPLLEVSRTAVFHHRVIEVHLSNGALLRMSAGHPLADGRLLGSVEVGDRLEGANVVERREIPTTSPSPTTSSPRPTATRTSPRAVLVGTTLRP